MTLWHDVPLPICTCGQVWTTPVDNSPQKSGRAMSLETNKSLTGSSTPREAVGPAVIDALDLLRAQLDAIEARLARLEISRFVNEKKTPAEQAAGVDPQT